METRDEIRVLVNTDHQLHRDSLKWIIGQQTDMTIVDFTPDGTEPTVWAAIRGECERCLSDERVAVIVSYQEDEESSFRERCGSWLVHFPGLIVIAVDWIQQRVIALRYELRCDDVPSSLRGLVNAIRHASSAGTPGEEPSET